jgi:hypothetical protein
MSIDGSTQILEEETIYDDEPTTNELAIIETNKTTSENKIIEELRKVYNHDFSLAYNTFQSKAAQSSKLNDDMMSLLKKMDKLLIAERDGIYKIENMMIKYPVVKSDIVKFNVGGTIFATYLSTITKKINKINGDGFYEPNLLQGLVSGLTDVKFDNNKDIFIDRNPKYFHYILDYLRMANTNATFKYPADFDELNGLLNEASYFDLIGLKEKFTGFSDSVILNSNQTQDLIKLCNFSTDDYWMLLYRGNRDGFFSKDFHRKVDGISKTLTIIKTTGKYIFGGLYFKC